MTAAAFFTYFWGYASPAELFWDENYHIASAQKYLHGVYFMEPHPPLGKLLIALGEWLVSPAANGASDQFLVTHYAEELPAAFSLAGFRLLPALLAWLAAPLLYLLLLAVTRRALLAGLLTTPYVFDNALIVHSRSAMLEPPLLFFALLTLLALVLMIERRPGGGQLRWLAGLFGAALAAAVTTKLVALVLILLVAPLAWRLGRRIGAAGLVRDLTLPAVLAFAIVFVGVWQAHFTLASTVQVELENQGYFLASEASRRILDEGVSGSLLHFGTRFADAQRFVTHYARGVPRLDLCKPDEAGSPWFFWPVGARAINYRWETEGGDEDATYRYLYLQSNPAAWALGLVGVFAALAFLLASVALPLHGRVAGRFLMLVFLGLWIAYMVAVSRIDRVMYLYHYFLPLLLSFVLFALALGAAGTGGRRGLDAHRREAIAGVCALAIVGCFFFYKPLTYYQPITDRDFMTRSWVDLWDLRCQRCERTGGLVRTVCE